MGVKLNAAAAHEVARLHDRSDGVSLISTDLHSTSLSQLAFVSWPQLHLSDNKLKALTVVSLPRLTHLGLSRKHIDAAAAITLTKGSLPQLVDLDLSNNYLTSAAMASLARGSGQI